jgi:uncharacterized protein
MTDASAPLLNLFYELRERSFPLGTSDYVTVLNALTKGAITTRADLLFACQLVWAKSPEEQRQVAEAFVNALPEELTEKALQALSEVALQDRMSTVPPTVKLESGPSSNASPVAPAPSQSNLEEVTEGLGPTILPAADAQMRSRLAQGVKGDLAVPALKTSWHVNPHLDFVGSLPITKRQMKRAWRYHRRMRRVGAPVELDVEATVEQIYRQGIFLKPVLIPRRQNQARILILIDERGSMVPFRRVTQALIDSAKQTGLAKALLFFFHDVPGEHLFYEPWLSSNESTARVLQLFVDAGVLIISDGGSARGNFEQSRVEQTKDFLRLVKRYTKNVAWLNPVPIERWKDTTAAAIRTEAPVPMFELNRTGLDAAVNILRGRGK